MRRRWLILFTTLLILAAGGWWGLPWLMPLPEALLQPPPSSTLYLARDGTPLRHLLDENGTRSAPPVQYAEIPPTLVHALLAAEDKRFFSHGGIDLLEVVRIRLRIRPDRFTQDPDAGALQPIPIQIPGVAPFDLSDAERRHRWLFGGLVRGWGIRPRRRGV